MNGEMKIGATSLHHPWEKDEKEESIIRDFVLSPPLKISNKFESGF